MRLKHIHIISQYKNLKDFKLDFDGDSFIDVFVGKNGTGKSNLFEAIIEIFRHLYEFGKKSFDINFDYSITYEIEDQDTEIKWEGNTLEVNGIERKTVVNTPLPDNVLIYYSGHNIKVSALVDDYENTFKSAIRKAKIKDTRKFIGVGKEYKQLLLSVLLMMPDENKANKYVKNKLQIQTVGKHLKLILKRPFFRDNSYKIDLGDDNTLYWGIKGISNEFLRRLATCNVEATEDGPKETGYFFSNRQKYPDRYVYFLDLKKIQKEFKNTSYQELFRQFDNLKTLEMLENISINITLNNKVDADVNYFSDGQFQAVYIYAIIEIFKDRNCITLLDEPDSFLHPEWQFEFLKQVFEITDNYSANNHVLMCSHSAATLVPYERKKVKFFDIKEHSVNCYSLPKQVAIKKLSSDLIKYSEQEQLLSIVNAIQIEKKSVLFTEGSTDPLIIKQAWFNLFEKEMPFIPFYAFSCTFLYQLLCDNRISEEMDDLPVFGLFDFDKAFNQWNGLNGRIIEDDPQKGMVKKCTEGNSYAIMLPVPENDNIKNMETKETYKEDSCCEIEHLFYGSKITDPYFIEEPHFGGGKKIIFKSDSDKTKFAKEIIPLVDKSYFEVFRPMFEFIEGKCK